MSSFVTTFPPAFFFLRTFLRPLGLGEMPVRVRPANNQQDRHNRRKTNQTTEKHQATKSKVTCQTKLSVGQGLGGVEWQIVHFCVPSPLSLCQWMYMREQSKCWRYRTRDGTYFPLFVVGWGGSLPVPSALPMCRSSSSHVGTLFSLPQIHQLFPFPFVVRTIPLSLERCRMH